MSAQTLWIPGQLPGLNEIIDASKRFAPRYYKRRRWNEWAEKKRIEEHKIGLCILRARLKPVPAAFFRFHWVEPDRRRNPDNIVSGGRKVIFDSLVRNGILPNDGWNQILGWEDTFAVDKRDYGVTVILDAKK